MVSLFKRTHIGSKVMPQEIKQSDCSPVFLCNNTITASCDYFAITILSDTVNRLSRVPRRLSFLHGCHQYHWHSVLHCYFHLLLGRGFVELKSDVLLLLVFTGEFFNLLTECCLLLYPMLFVCIMLLFSQRFLQLLFIFMFCLGLLTHSLFISCIN